MFLECSDGVMARSLLLHHGQQRLHRDVLLLGIILEERLFLREPLLIPEQLHSRSEDQTVRASLSIR